MFDALTGRGRPGGFLTATQAMKRKTLEKLEERDVPAIISGFVFADANANGIKDPGEVGIANSTIQLFDSSNQLIATTVTDAAGAYQFTHKGGPMPAPGSKTYELSFDQAKTNLTRNGTLPMFDPSLGQLTSVEILAQGTLLSKVVVENLETNPTELDAELKGLLRYTVNGRTMTSTPTQILQTNVAAFDGIPDLDGSSAHDFGIIQLVGSFQTMTLTSPSDLAAFTGTGTINVAELARMQSSFSGSGNLMGAVSTVTQGKVSVVYHYQPGNDLGPGTYRIVQANQPAGYLDGLESSNGVVIPGSNRTDSITVTIHHQNDHSANNNFGEIRGSSISGTVYHDVNRTGSFSPGDRGIGGVQMTLTGVDVFGAQVTRTVFTNANGLYGFNNLITGNYTIRQTQPAGYQQGQNNVGSEGGTVAGDTISLQLRQATQAINYNFGEYLSVTPPAPPLTAQPPGKAFFTGRNAWNFAW